MSVSGQGLLRLHQLPGYLLVGARDDGTLDGLIVTEQLLQNLSAIRTDGNVIPPPSMAVQKFTFSNGELAIVEVQPHYQPPVKYKHSILVRVGPTKRVANDVDEIILNESAHPLQKPLIPFLVWAVHRRI